MPKLILSLVLRFCGSIAFAAALVLSLSFSTVAQRTRPASNPAAPPTTTTQLPKAEAREPKLPEVQLEHLPADPAVEEADIAITAHVKASSLRFDEVPNPSVEFPGQPKRDTVWEAQRENLPTPVQPGVTYRNIGIRLKITSVFSDIDRIVAEALGEIPIVDEKPNAPASNPSSTQKVQSPVLQSAPPPTPPNERQ